MSSPQEDFGFDFISEDEIQSRYEKPEESFLEGQVVRRGKRALQRGKENILGLPGDMFQLVRSLGSLLPGGVQPEEELNFLQRPVRQFVESLPGSAELRAKGAEERPELEPRTELERIEDEVVGDLSVLALPVKGKIPFARALGMSMAGNLGKETVAAFGGGDTAQESTKLGLMVFTGMFGKGKGIKKHISNLYKNADHLIEEGATVDYSKSLNRLNNLESELRKGAIDASGKPVLNMIEEIRAKAPQGRMAVEEAVGFDRSINELMGDPALLKRGKKLLGGVKGAHSDALGQYAAENPTWGETWKEAKQAYQGIAQSQKIQNYIKRSLSLKDYLHAGAALGMEEFMLPGKAIGQVGALTGAAGTAYMGEVARRIATNPALRKYYANVLNASLTENKAMLIRNMKGLERTMAKDIEENPIHLFDFSEED